MTAPIRVAAVMPEPTPYRTPLFDRLAARPELDLTVVYSARAIAGNAWRIEPQHRHVFLEGVRVPGASRILRHDYPLTFGIVGELERLKPQCVVITGWSTFASQAAFLWCRVRRVPYVLLTESHDRGARAGWRRTVKGAVVPRVVRGASSVLVAGTLARESMVARGADPERIGVFANTIDVERFAADAAGRRDEARAKLGLAPESVAVLCVARLSPEKRIDVLLRAAVQVGAPVHVVVAGEGPSRAELEALTAPVSFLGALPWERLVDVYAAADVFALLSDFETWGVVVNEAAAAGLPLVLAEGVGSAPDLLHDGENGFLVPVGDVDATADALRRLAGDAALRERAGSESRRIVAGWGYERSEDDFVRAVLSTVRS
jgi:glycosyltransferase involved in cell wall biosynthesis